MQPIDIHILIFGQDETPRLKSAFDAAFGFEENLKIWATIGINPFNRKYLSDSNVKYKVIIEEDGSININANLLTSKLLHIED